MALISRILTVLVIVGMKFPSGKPAKTCKHCSPQVVGEDACKQDTQIECNEETDLLTRLGLNGFFENIQLKSSVDTFRCFILDFEARNENDPNDMPTIYRFKSCIATDTCICNLDPTSNYSVKKLSCKLCNEDNCNESYELPPKVKQKVEDPKSYKPHKDPNDGDTEHTSTIEMYSIVFCVAVILVMSFFLLGWIIAKKTLHY